jgi:hypothetical protein
MTGVISALPRGSMRRTMTGVIAPMTRGRTRLPRVLWLPVLRILFHGRHSFFLGEHGQLTPAAA